MRNERADAEPGWSIPGERRQNGYAVAALIALFLLGWFGLLLVYAVFAHATSRLAAGGRSPAYGRRLLALGRWLRPRFGRARRGELRRLLPGALRACAFVVPVALLIHVPGFAFALLHVAFRPSGQEAQALAGLAAVACAAPIMRLLMVPIVGAAIPASARQRTGLPQTWEGFVGSLVACSFAAAALLLLVGLPSYYGVGVSELGNLAREEDTPEGAAVFALFVAAAMSSVLLFLASGLAIDSEVRRVRGEAPGEPLPRPAAGSRAAPGPATVIRRTPVQVVERRASMLPLVPARTPVVAAAPAVDRAAVAGPWASAAPEPVAPFVVASLVLAMPLGWLGFALPYAVFVIRCCRIAAGRRVRRPIGDAVATLVRWCRRKALGGRPEELERRIPGLLRLSGVVFFLFLMQLFPGTFYLVPFLIFDQFVVSFGEGLATVIGLLLALYVLPAAVRHGAWHVVHLALKRNLLAEPALNALRRSVDGRFGLGSYGFAFALGLLAVPLLGFPLLLGLGPFDLVCAAVGPGVTWVGPLRGVFVLAAMAGLLMIVYLLSRRYFAGATRDYLNVARELHELPPP